MTERFAVIGSGLIGRAWAIVFARAGREVRLWDMSDAALQDAGVRLGENLKDLEAQGLIPDAAAARARVTLAGSLEEALNGATWMQESVAEKAEIKAELFARAAAVAGPDAILASSSSAIAASRFTEHVTGRERCLIAHPVNPPYLIPLVELCPAPWTDPAVPDRARAIMDSVGMVPVTVNREIEGFVLNRLQGALLAEAFRLVDDGIASVEDVDRTVRDGLGLRWSFMGPFETIDLNAPDGLSDYCDRYGPFYKRVQDEAAPREWDADLVGRVEAERRRNLPKTGLSARQSWRDRRLMALLRHKREADTDHGT